MATGRTLTLDGPGTVNPNGVMDIAGGDLTLTQSTPASFTNGGTLAIGTGRTFKVSGGTLTNAGVLNGTGTLDVALAAFSNSGSINPGTSPGILSIIGDLPPSTGVLNIELGGLTLGT